MVGDVEVPVYTMADELVNPEAMAVPVSIVIDGVGTSPRELVPPLGESFETVATTTGVVILKLIPLM